MKKLLSFVLCFAFVMTGSASFSVSAAKSEISKVAVTGVVDAAIGQSPTTDGITVPSGAGYKITDMYWQDYTARTMDFSRFENLHKYVLNITLKVNDGYYFDNSPIVTVNGKEISGELFPRYDNHINITLEYSFLKEIKKIELPAFPSKVPLGNTNKPYENTDPPLIENDEYIVNAFWLNTYKNGDTLYQGEVRGEFVDGRLYFYEYGIGAKTGYEITENTVITVGGKKVSDGIYNSVLYNSASVYNTYNLANLKPISKIEISLEKPIIGNAVNKKFTSKTLGVKFVDFLIDDSANEKLVKRENLGVMELTNKESSGNYSDKRYYTVKGVVEAVDGYYFTDDLKITVNGKEADIFRYLIDNMLEENSPFEFAPFMLYLGKPEPKPVVSKPEESSDDSSSIESEPESSEVTSSTPEPEPEPEPTVTEPEKDGNTALIITLAAGGALLIGGGIFLIIFLNKKKKSE